MEVVSIVRRSEDRRKETDCRRSDWDRFLKSFGVGLQRTRSEFYDSSGTVESPCSADWISSGQSRRKRGESSVNKLVGSRT